MHGVAVSAGYAPWVAGLATAAVTAPLNYLGGRITLVSRRQAAERLVVFVHPQGIIRERSGRCRHPDLGVRPCPARRPDRRDCNICDHVFIENDVVIGDRVTIKCGVQLWDGVRVEDDVFIGPNATFTNDLFPRSKEHSPSALSRRSAAARPSGPNATILPGITVGRGRHGGRGRRRHAGRAGERDRRRQPGAHRRLRRTSRGRPAAGAAVRAAAGARRSRRSCCPDHAGSRPARARSSRPSSRRTSPFTPQRVFSSTTCRHRGAR